MGDKMSVIKKRKYLVGGPPIVLPFNFPVNIWTISLRSKWVMEIEYYSNCRKSICFKLSLPHKEDSPHSNWFRILIIIANKAIAIDLFYKNGNKKR